MCPDVSSWNFPAFIGWKFCNVDKRGCNSLSRNQALDRHDFYPKCSIQGGIKGLTRTEIQRGGWKSSFQPSTTVRARGRRMQPVEEPSNMARIALIIFTNLRFWSCGCSVKILLFGVKVRKSNCRVSISISPVCSICPPAEFHFNSEKGLLWKQQSIALSEDLDQFLPLSVAFIFLFFIFACSHLLTVQNLISWIVFALCCEIEGLNQAVSPENMLRVRLCMPPKCSMINKLMRSCNMSAVFCRWEDHCSVNRKHLENNPTMSM